MITAKITDVELLLHMEELEKDGMSVFVTKDGVFRGALFHGTRFINQMRAQHSLGILETLILGQACLCGALMIPTMKGPEHLIFKYDTDGPAAGFSVEVDSRGSVRGFLLQNPIPVSAPLKSWDLSPFFGQGSLRVSRFPEGRSGKNSEGKTGMVEIQYKNIAKDLTWYFEQSEQIYTAFNTSIHFDTDGRVIGAGGLFIQSNVDRVSNVARGGTSGNDELLLRMEHAFNACPSLGQWFSEKHGREDIIYGLFREFKPSIAFERDIVFDCQCSKERYVKAVRSLSKAEIDDIKKNSPSPLEILCHNCGSVYHIPVEEL